MVCCRTTPRDAPAATRRRPLGEGCVVIADEEPAFDEPGLTRDPSGSAAFEEVATEVDGELSRRQVDAWQTRAELAQAIFEWIEAFYNPHRRHSPLGYLSPFGCENRHTPTKAVA
jgi:putative transposase